MSSNRGRKKAGHKGGKKHFSSATEIENQQAEIRKIRAAQEAGGDEADELQRKADEEREQRRVVSFDAKGKKGGDKGSSSGSDSETSSEDEGRPPVGVQNLIDIENPNRVTRVTKKVTELQLDEGPQMSRKEREAAEKEAAKRRYQELHAQGKTDEAQADLARLAIIRKQREEAAKKRDEEKHRKEAEEKERKERELERRKQQESKASKPGGKKASKK